MRSNKKEELFLIYPNPASGSFIVSVKEFSSEGYSISISNSVGQVVFTKDDNTTEQIKLSPDLSDGVYTISLLINEEIFNKKLIIRGN